MPLRNPFNRKTQKPPTLNAREPVRFTRKKGKPTRIPLSIKLLPRPLQALALVGMAAPGGLQPTHAERIRQARQAFFQGNLEKASIKEMQNRNEQIQQAANQFREALNKSVAHVRKIEFELGELNKKPVLTPADEEHGISLIKEQEAELQHITKVGEEANRELDLFNQEFEHQVSKGVLTTKTAEELLRQYKEAGYGLYRRFKPGK